jgi:hypothetical protein
MRNTRHKIQRSILALAILLPALCVSFTFAQSQSQNLPTPVRTNEINGAIKARDIGDPRLTSYFYAFNGTQGDIFINVVTKNFNGDIDVFTVEGLRALTKIVVYADSPVSETGRLIYLRKPEKLLLRIEGRSPNDDPATFRIKFAGSFEAITGGPDTPGPELPDIKAENESGIRVNSVGTIIEVVPKPKPTPKETVAKVEEKKDAQAEEEKPSDDTEAKTENAPESKPRVLVSENIPPPIKKAVTPPRKVPGKPVRKPVKPAETAKVEETGKEPAGKAKPGATKPKAAPPKDPPPPNPLENIRLVILFKDGKKIERPMSEVIRFNVDKGILTIVLKDGTIARHSLLDVEKVTIE